MVLVHVKRMNVYVFLFFLGVSFFFPRLTWARINLSVNPVRGSNSLKWSRLSVDNAENLEVRVRINSSDGKQYQVYQRVVEAIVNERGNSLNFDAIRTYSLRGSNSFGVLYTQTLENLTRSDQLIYSSGGNGDSDSFLMVYQLDKDRLNGGGNYFGKIQYIVRPVGSSSFDERFIDVFIQVESDLKFEIEGSSSKNSVRLSTENQRQKEGFVKLSFSGNSFENIKIYQELLALPENNFLEPIGRSAIQFKTSGDAKGDEHQSSFINLRPERKLIYSSKENEDSIYVQVELGSDVIEEKSGLYRGRVNYILETETNTSEKNLDLEVDIGSIFKIDVVFPPGGVNFSKLLPNQPPQYNKVEVNVVSNTGKPYVVTQDVLSGMTNSKGDVIERKYFTIRQELVGDSKGKVKSSEYQPVRAGDTVLYESDSKGSSGKFVVTYRLSPYQNMIAGDYTTSIVYSLGEK